MWWMALKAPTGMQRVALDCKECGLTYPQAVQALRLKISPWAMYKRIYRYRKANGINAHAPKYRSWQLSTCKNI